MKRYEYICCACGHNFYDEEPEEEDVVCPECKNTSCERA